MTDSVDAVASLQMRLAIHRRTLVYLEEQRAQFGALTPTHVRHQLDETRAQIAQIKGELRTLGAPVDEQPGDVESDWRVAPAPGLRADGLRAYLRTLLDRLSYLSLDGLAEWRGPAVQLDRIYVERVLVPLSSGGQHASLASLVADRHTRLLIEAEAGAGKSVALRRLALACAAISLGDEEAGAFFPRRLDPPLVPLLLDAGDLVRTSAYGENGTAGSLGVWDAIEATLRRDGLASALQQIEHALRVGDCLVLIDGLDDIVDTERGRSLLGMLGRFVARYPDSRYIITCRRLGALSAAALHGFSVYALPPLDDDGMDSLVATYFPLVAPINALAFDDGEAQIKRLCASLRAHERLHALASNALGAVLCVLSQAAGASLPNARGRVFAHMIDLLLNGWELRRRDEGVLALAQLLEVEMLGRREARLALLQPLALAFHTRPDLSGDMPATMRYAEIEPWLRESLMLIGVDSRRAIEQVIPRLLAVCRREGLLVFDEATGEYAMPMRHLREYLAARALTAQQDFPARAYALAAEPRWRETLLLAVRELHDGVGAHTARELLRLLLETSSTDFERIIGDPLLAAECLAEFATLSGPERLMLADVQDRLQEIQRTPNVSTPDRVRAGLMLGRLGDPRFANLLPPLVRVPAGHFLFGTREGYEDEGPQQWVDLRAFAIGMYPVTNREYARFLADRPEHPVPKYWNDSVYNNPSQPVVGVTWHDAVAFCRWLTDKLHASGMLPASLDVRLPLEVEWEKAASWDARKRVKRRYPWGEEWQPGAANTAEGRGAWVTAPVGSFPQGVSPCGAHEMIGNIWEWTLSEYASYPGALAPFHEPGSYTLRGSSCASLPTHARCTYRSRLPPDYWRYHLGFRVVLGTPLAILDRMKDEG